MNQPALDDFQEIPKQASAPRQETVLIVDDDPVNLRLLLEVLQSDYRVLVATSGRQALKLVDKHNDIDLMLLDVDMPEMSGFEVLERIQSHPSKWQLPVMMVTAKNQPGDEVYGLAHGAVDYISKPITAAVVKARVRTQLSLARAKQTLAKQNQELALALQASRLAKNELTEFTAMVSHELRTPVAVLLCEIELLVDGIRKPDAKNLESLQEEVKHFSHLIDDMFDLVLSEAGTLKYNKEACELHTLVKRSLELFEPQFTDQSIQLWADLDSLEGSFVYADVQRIKQVMDNIIKNSLKYTDSGGKLVVSGEIKQESNVNWQWIHFQDSAPGVAEEELDKLFDRLYRVEKSRNRATGGAGLGLAVCKTIVSDHGGKIFAGHSHYGGVCISVGFPALKQ